MRVLCLAAILLLSHCVLRAQSPTLEVRNGTWGKTLYADGVQVDKQTFSGHMQQQNEAAARMFRSGRSMEGWGTALGSIGAFCVGYSLGYMIGGGDLEPMLLAGGGVVMAGGIVLSICGVKKIKKSINLYEESCKGTPVSLRLDISPAGAGLCMVF